MIEIIYFTNWEIIVMLPYFKKNFIRGLLHWHLHICLPKYLTLFLMESKIVATTKNTYLSLKGSKNKELDVALLSYYPFIP